MTELLGRLQMKDCSALGPSNMHHFCLPGLPCRIDPIGQNATEKKKNHADGIFLMSLPILPLDLVKLLGTFLKTGYFKGLSKRDTLC